MFHALSSATVHFTAVVTTLIGHPTLVVTCKPYINFLLSLYILWPYASGLLDESSQVKSLYILVFCIFPFLCCTAFIYARLMRLLIPLSLSLSFVIVRRRPHWSELRSIWPPEVGETATKSSPARLKHSLGGCAIDMPVELPSAGHVVSPCLLSYVRSR